MSTAVITVDDQTGNDEPWTETSPNDPSTYTVEAYGSETITKTVDDGPWTVSFTNINKRGVVQRNTDGTTATVTLAESGNTFRVTVSD